MKHKKIIILFICVLMIVPSLSAKGRGKHHGKEGCPEHKFHLKAMGWWHSPHLLSELNLTEKQSDKMLEIKAEAEKQLIKKGANLAEKMIDLRTEMAKTELNEKKIKNIIDDIAKIKGENFKTRMSYRLKGLKVLTKDQRKKLKKMILTDPPHHKKRKRDKK